MEKDLIMKYNDPKEPLYKGMGSSIYISKEEALKQFPDQPERSKREDSSKDEMRCSEHYGNIVRDK